MEVVKVYNKLKANQEKLLEKSIQLWMLSKYKPNLVAKKLKKFD